VITVRLPRAVQRFIDEKFPEDPFYRWLIALAFVFGPILYAVNWYFSLRFWWNLFH
jgi:hypothetical protein